MNTDKHRSGKKVPKPAREQGRSGVQSSSFSLLLLCGLCVSALKILYFFRTAQIVTSVTDVTAASSVTNVTQKRAARFQKRNSPPRVQQAVLSLKMFVISEREVKIHKSRRFHRLAVACKRLEFPTSDRVTGSRLEQSVAA